MLTYVSFSQNGNPHKKNLLLGSFSYLPQLFRYQDFMNSQRAQVRPHEKFPIQQVSAPMHILLFRHSFQHILLHISKIIAETKKTREVLYSIDSESIEKLGQKKNHKKKLVSKKFLGLEKKSSRTTHSLKCTKKSDQNLERKRVLHTCTVQDPAMSQSVVNETMHKKLSIH